MDTVSLKNVKLVIYVASSILNNLFSKNSVVSILKYFLRYLTKDNLKTFIPIIFKYIFLISRKWFSRLLFFGKMLVKILTVKILT